MRPDSTTATFDLHVANQVDAGTLEMLQQNTLLLILILVGPVRGRGDTVQEGPKPQAQGRVAPLTRPHQVRRGHLPEATYSSMSGLISAFSARFVVPKVQD